ncbi:MAG: hypothetical protein LAP86_29465 [Acidobacteriia bacterium]|jgi:hypothetical protein|nr:hypothetical protein [Terriglobia bacterium]
MKQTLLGLVLVLVLVAFAGIGIAHIFKPDWFIKRSGVRRGGEMLSEYNRAGFQIAGAVFAAIAIYMLYSLFRH